MKQGYDQKPADEQLEKVDKLLRDDLQQEKDQEQQDAKCISLIITIITYNRLLPNLTAVVHQTGTSSKPTKIYQNYLKNTQSQPLRETKI